MTRERIHGWIGSAVLVMLGVVAGSMLREPPTALGQQPIPPKTFKSGSQISVPILQDIAATLHQMDERLARLEIVATKAMKTPPRTTSGGRN